MEFYTISQRRSSPTEHRSTAGYTMGLFACILLNSKQEDKSNITPEILMEQGKTVNKNLYNGKLYNINIKNVPRHIPEFIIKTGAEKKRKFPVHRYFTTNTNKAILTAALIKKLLPDFAKEKLIS